MTGIQREEVIMLNKQQNGFTLVELMVSMVIGLFLLTGVFTIYLNSRDSQRVVEEEVRMMDNARFALDTIAYDLRHAGAYGHRNHEDLGKVRDLTTFSTVTGQCGGAGSGWVVDVEKPVYAVDLGTDYLADCMTGWDQGDTIEVRYATALPLNTVEANLISDALYLKSIGEYSHLFKGDTPPDAYLFDGKPDIRYFLWQARGYYISNFTDQVGDGVPSLRLVSLEPGPVVNDSILLRGVEDIEIQLGLDTPTVAGTTQGDGSADSYIHPLVTFDKWNQVISARVWLVLRSEKQYEDINPLQSYQVAGAGRVYNDQFKRIVVSTSVRLRNMNTETR